MDNEFLEDWIEETQSKPHVLNSAKTLAGHIIREETLDIPSNKLTENTLDQDISDQQFFTKKDENFSFSNLNYLTLAVSELTIEEVLFPNRLEKDIIINLLRERSGALLRMGGENILEETTWLLLKRKYNQDVLSLVDQIIETDRDFWALHHSLSKALKRIDFGAKALKKFYERIIKLTGGATGSIWETFRFIGEYKPDLSKKIYAEFIDSEEDKLVYLLEYLLIGQANTAFEETFKHVVKLTDSKISSESNLGIITLCELNYKNRDDFLDKTIKLLRTLHKNTSDQKSKIFLVRGISNLIKYRSEIGEWLKDYLPVIDSDLYEVILRCLYLNKDQKDSPWFKEVLKSLLVDSSQFSKNLTDQVLNYYSESDHLFIEEVWEAMLSDNDNFEISKSITEIFSSTWLSLKNKHPEFCYKLYTSWLLKEDINFHFAGAKLINSYTTFGNEEPFNPISFDANIIAQSDLKELKFLLFKLMGFVFESKVLCSLAFSLLQVKNEQIEGLVENAFSEEIAYNYPHLIDLFLKEKAASGNEVEKRVSKKIIKNIEKYLNELESLPRLQELSTPKERLRPLQLRSRKQQKEISKQVEEKSILRHIVNNIPIKYSSNFFSSYMGNISEKTPMVKHQTSFSLPRNEFIDPVGANSQRFMRRVIKKDEI